MQNRLICFTIIFIVLELFTGISAANSSTEENRTGEIIVDPQISWNPDMPVSPEYAIFTISGPYLYSGNESYWTKSDTPAGTYTINYGPINGYETPASETKTLAVGNSITFSGNYLLKKKVGESLDLGDGHTLLIKQIDPVMNEMLMELQLDGRKIDEITVTGKESYFVCKRSFSVNESGKPICLDIFLENTSIEINDSYAYIYIERPQLALDPYGLLTITSTPEGAEIRLDDSYVGTTPKSIPINELKTYSIRLEISGYESWEGKYNFDQLEEKNVAVPLNRKLSNQ